MDGSSSRYGNMGDEGPRGKPQKLEELQLRSTHYGGPIDKLLTTQRVGQGFKVPGGK